MSDTAQIRRERIAYLISQCVIDAITADEARELEMYCLEQPDLRHLIMHLNDKSNLRELLVIRSQAGKGKDFNSLLAGLSSQQPRVKKKGKLITWIIGSAAAASLLFFAVKTFRMRESPAHIASAKKGEMPQSSSPSSAISTTIFMSNGENIQLSSATKGQVMYKYGASIKHDSLNHITWQSQGSASPTSKTQTYVPIMARMETPADGQFSITLPDGSKAWLNRSSSLQFPSAFHGTKREVEITGEVYFEIAKNTWQPFIVRNIGEMDSLNIEVLGTSFNVMAYPDTSCIRATLVTGKIRVAQHRRTKELTPGQQLIVQSDGKWVVRKDVSTDDVIAWQQDKFVFSNDSLQVALRKLARWYKVEMEIPATLKGPPVNGTLPRNSGLENLLESISNHKKIFQYKREHDKMIISQ